MKLRWLTSIILFITTLVWTSGCAGPDTPVTSADRPLIPATPDNQPEPLDPPASQEINSFEACVQAGFPVMESYPRQCMTAAGQSFTENIEGNAVVTSATVEPENPAEVGLSAYPDLPLETLPAEPISVNFLIEHRSALNNQEVRVQGVIVETLLGEKACPPDRGMCAQPSLFLAEKLDDNRDLLYDLRILVSEAEQETDYELGQTVEIQGLVQADQAVVVVQKIY